MWHLILSEIKYNRKLIWYLLIIMILWDIPVIIIKDYFFVQAGPILGLIFIIYWQSNLNRQHRDDMFALLPFKPLTIGLFRAFFPVVFILLMLIFETLKIEGLTILLSMKTGRGTEIQEFSEMSMILIYFGIIIAVNLIIHSLHTIVNDLKKILLPEEYKPVVGVLIVFAIMFCFSLWFSSSLLSNYLGIMSYILFLLTTLLFAVLSSVYLFIRRKKYV